MNTFMPDLDGNNEEVASGKIVILQDANGDGQTDKRKVFLDNVVLPRTISIVEKGILYSDQTQLYFAEVWPTTAWFTRGSGCRLRERR